MRTAASRTLTTLAATFACAFRVPAAAAGEIDAVTFYVARLTTVNAWHDIPTDPGATEFADAYLAVIAASRTVHWFPDRTASAFAEAQVGYNFGDQSHWEFNVAGGPRWHRFPWSDRIETTAAFGIGLSYATEIPAVEVALEETSERLLVYWMMEATLAPPGSRWAVSLRLHHRSTGFGLFADEGGMNALGAGVRIDF
jgi:hypothetical protein